MDRALRHVEEAYHLAPTSFRQFHLWGKMLVAIGTETHLEEALKRYEQAFEVEGERGELLWDWALAWRALYRFSTEIADLYKSERFFKRAAAAQIKTVPFFLDYGCCLQRLAQVTGEPHYLYQAREMFRLARRVQPRDIRDEEEIAKALVYAQSDLVGLTQSEHEYEVANRLFHETIVAHPASADLWLRWGEMLLRFGWQRRHAPSIEAAIEKLTSLKIVEADPVETAALLSEALMALGVVLDHGQLFFEGKQRLKESCPTHRSVRQATAFSRLATALYFSQKETLQEAIDAFTALSVYPNHCDVYAWEGLFEAYFFLGELSRTPLPFSKAFAAARRLTELRPHVPLYQTKAAESLLRLCAVDVQIKRPDRVIEQAIRRLIRALTIREEWNTVFYLACAWDALGEITGDERCYVTAIQKFESLYASLPTDLRVGTHLGITLMHFGKYGSQSEALVRAHALFERALQHDSENGLLLVKMGHCKLLIAETATQERAAWYGDAERVLKQAVAQGEGEAFYDLAALYSLTGRLESAMEALRQAKARCALPPAEELEHVTWLEEVRQTVAFQEFVEALKR